VVEGFSILFFAPGVVLASILIVGLGALFRVRRAQRERMQMRQHLQRIELSCKK
jgi:hypothetical protein